MAQKAALLSRPEIPDLPGIVLVPGTPGVDPQLNIDLDILGSPGNVTTVSVELDDATGVASATFDVFYDAAVLSITTPGDVDFGSLWPVGDGWSLNSNVVTPGHLRVVLFNSTATATGPGEIAQLNFTVDTWATPGSTPLDIEPVDPNEGGLSWTESDGSILIEPWFVAQLKLDETTGATATDTSPHGNDNQGLLVNGASFLADSERGQVVVLDGSDDYVQLSDSNDINLGTHSVRTVSLWFKADDVSISARKQVLYEEGGKTRGLNIYLYDGQLYVGGWNAIAGESDWGGTFLATAAPTDGQWHHVALTLEGGSTVSTDALKAYLDGTLVGSGDGSQLWNHVGDIGFGNMAEGTLFHDGGVVGSPVHGFAGAIDEARIYNRALGAAAIADLADDRVALWRLDETGGTTAIDTAGGNHGTLENGAMFVADADRGQVMGLDGNDDYMSVPDNYEINQSIHSARTVSLWFKADDVDIASRKQVLYEEGGAARGLNIYLYDGQLYVGGWNAVAGESNWSGTFLTMAAPTDGQWHHVALTLQGGPSVTTDALKAYLDGGFVDSGDGSQLWSHVGDIGIGNMNEGTLFHDGGAVGSPVHGFAGSIDEASVYNRALDATEVSQLHSDGIGGAMAYGALDETSGTTSADNVGSDDALLEDGALFFGDADRGEYGQALLHDSAMAALLEADGNWAKPSDDVLSFAHWVADFDFVKAHGSSNPGDTKQIVDIIFSLDVEDIWA